MDYLQYFRFTMRQVDNSEIVILSDDAPEKLKEFVRSVHMDHFGMSMPNDWIYRTIYEAFDELSRDKLDDITIESDIYTCDYMKWFSDNYAYASDFVNEWLDEFSNKHLDIDKAICGGQWLTKDRIYHAVNDFLTEERDV